MLKKIITNSLELNKYFNLISKRYSRWSFNLVNIAFSIFIGLSFFFSMKNLLVNKAEAGLIFFIASIVLSFIAELINLMAKNSFISNYTLDRIDIYAISKYEHFFNLFISNIIYIRWLYYFIFFVLLFLLTENYKIVNFIKISILFVFIYLSATIIFTLIDYAYASLIKYVGNKARYSFLFFFLFITWGMKLIDKYEVNIKYLSTLFKTYIYSFINKW